MSALDSRFSDLNKQGFMKRVYQTRDAKPKKAKSLEKVSVKPACKTCQGGSDCACWIAYQQETFGSAVNH